MIIHRREIWLLMTLLIITTILYLPSLNNEFNNWDDAPYITRNPNIELTKENVKKSFLQGENHGMYIPLTALSHSIIYHFWGLKPKPYYVTNLMIHLCNIILVFIFISLLFNNPLLALISSALFALHPMQVESVAYAAGRREILCAFFYLLSLIFYLKYNRYNYNLLFLSILFALLSLLSKGLSLVIPATLILIDILKGRKFERVAVLDKIPFILIAAFVGWMIYHAPLHATGDFSPASFFDDKIPYTTSTNGYLVDIKMYVDYYDRLIYAGYGFVQYIILLLYPYKLSILQSYPSGSRGYIIPSFYYAYAILTALIIAATVVLSFIIVARRKTVSDGNLRQWFGVAFFIINIVILLQIVRNSYALTNDHYVYFSSVGIFLLFSHFMVKGIDRAKMRSIPISLLIVYICGLAFTSSERIGVFKNSITLWTDVIKKYPTEGKAIGNLSIAYLVKGIDAEKKENYEAAINNYNSAIKWNPSNINALQNASILADKNGRHEEALIGLNAALKYDSLNPTLYLNKGAVLQGMGRQNESLDCLNRAIELKPSYSVAFINRAMIRLGMNDYEGTKQDCDSAIASGNNPRYFYIRSLAERLLGRNSEAVNDIEECYKRDNRQGIAAYEEILDYLLATRQYNYAVTVCNRLTQLDPGNRKAAQIILSLQQHQTSSG